MEQLTALRKKYKSGEMCSMENGSFVFQGILLSEKLSADNKFFSGSRL